MKAIKGESVPQFVARGQKSNNRCASEIPGVLCQSKRAPFARIVAMKKRKKTAVAKPLSTRTARSRVKAGAKISKAKPAKVVKKKVAKKTRKVAAKVAKRAAPKKLVTAAKPKPAAKPKVLAKPKRRTKTEPAIAAEPVAETKPQPIAPKKIFASAKAAPQSVHFESEPRRIRKATGKVVSLADFAPKAPSKVVPKPNVKTSPDSEPRSAVPSKPPEEEKPEMAVELLFERKKASAKPKVKTKRVTKPKTVAATPPPAETKPTIETKAPAEKPVSIVTPPETKQSPPAARKMPANIPSILLEGDKPEPAPASGPGQRYALGPTPPVEKLQIEGELPESYGTGAILLTARDPHWLYTHWDLSSEQQRNYNGSSRDGHLIVRIYADTARGKPVAQAHVHPESRHWFVNVERANTRYVAELGYYSAANKWKMIATSDATLTPPDAVSTDTTAEFGTMPPEVPMEKLVALVKEAVQESAPLAQAIAELREDGHPELPRIEVETTVQTPGQFHSSSRPETAPRRKTLRWKPSEWTPAQERALAEVISMDHVRRVWMGSLEITELIRRQYVNELASMAAADLAELAPGAPPTSTIGGISSPVVKPSAHEKGFWFNVNAELIVYGATEPNATVSIGGRKIKLRPDGSFSYRFALPDGNYELPVVAISADETDGRAAELKFSRGTEYCGDVGAHPQDPSLQRMMLENF
jgi:hypothetical protein